MQVLGAAEIVDWAGCYNTEPFCGEIGVNQGYPLSPTIFNVVVDAVRPV